MSDGKSEIIESDVLVVGGGTSRDPGFRFVCGQFTMLGLEVDGSPLLRLRYDQRNLRGRAGVLQHQGEAMVR